MPEEEKKRLAKFALCFVIFIDSLGFAIIFPMLNPLFMNIHESLLDASYSDKVRHIFYGLTLGTFSLSVFFFSPILGDLSDKLGRKQVLMLTLLGSTLSYWLSGVATSIKSLALFFLSRFFAGLTAGSQPVAQAAMIDLSSSGQKAHNLSLMILSVALGWVAGPLLGGYLSDPSISKRFSPTFTFFIAALLSLCNLLIFIYAFRKQPAKNPQKTRLHFLSGIYLIADAFTSRTLCLLSWIFTIMQLGWGLYFSYVALYLSNHLGLAPHAIGVFIGCIAAGFAITRVLIKLFIERFEIEHTTTAALFVSALAMLAVLGPAAYAPYDLPLQDALFLGLVSLGVGVGVGVSYTLLLTLFSNRCKKSEQGKVMGMTWALGAAMWAVSGLLGGWISNLREYLPLLMGGSLLMVAAGLMAFEKKFR